MYEIIELAEHTCKTVTSSARVRMKFSVAKTIIFRCGFSCRKSQRMKFSPFLVRPLSPVMSMSCRERASTKGACFWRFRCSWRYVEGSPGKDEAIPLSWAARSFFSQTFGIETVGWAITSALSSCLPTWKGQRSSFPPYSWGVKWRSCLFRRFKTTLPGQWANSLHPQVNVALSSSSAAFLSLRERVW